MATIIKKTKKHVVRYTEEDRTKLLNAYQKLRNSGNKASAAAKEVGVPYITLRTWQKNIEVKAGGARRVVKAPARGAKVVKSRKRKVSAVPVPITLVLPNGTRVECATADDAVQFLKANQ